MRRIYKQRRNPWQRFQFSPAQLYRIMWTSRHQKEPHSRGKWTLSIYGPLVEIFFSFQKRDFFHFGIEYITGKIPLFRMNSFYWNFPAHPPDTIVRDISWSDRMEPKFQAGRNHWRFYVHIKPAEPLAPNCDPPSPLLWPNFQFCQLARVHPPLVRIRPCGINCGAEEVLFGMLSTKKLLNWNPCVAKGIWARSLCGFQCKPVWILSAVVNSHIKAHIKHFVVDQI